MKSNFQWRTGGLIALSALVASAAPAAVTADAAPVQEDATVALPFGVGGPVDSAELGQIAGRADLAQYVQAENNATVSRNSVSGNSVTGAIAFDAQAFQNMNGLSLLSANTGNNVAINSSLNVNVSIHP